MNKSMSLLIEEFNKADLRFCKYRMKLVLILLFSISKSKNGLRSNFELTKLDKIVISSIKAFFPLESDIESRFKSDNVKSFSNDSNE